MNLKKTEELKAELEKQLKEKVEQIRCDSCGFLCDEEDMEWKVCSECRNQVEEDRNERD